MDSGRIKIVLFYTDILALYVVSSLVEGMSFERTNRHRQYAQSWNGKQTFTAHVARMLGVVPSNEPSAPFVAWRRASIGVVRS